MATRWAGSPPRGDGGNATASSVWQAKRKDGRDQSESCPVSPATEEEPFSWAGPKTLRLRRTSAGFGFTLRHFIVYPPESAIHSSLKDEDRGSHGRPRNRLEPMDTIFVKQVKEGGPAHRAGLCTGDRIVKVNRECIIGKTYSQVIALIQNSDASLELSVMPKDEDILQLFSRDITALAYSHDAYLKGHEAYSGNAHNIPEPPPISYPRIETKISGMVLAVEPPGPAEALCAAGQATSRRSNPELSYRMELPVPPSSLPPSQVAKPPAAVCAYSESARAVAEPAGPPEQPAPPTWSDSTPSHRTEENRYGAPADADAAAGRPRGQLRYGPVQVHSQSYPDVSPTASLGPVVPAAPAPASASTSPCSTRHNIDWRNYTTYKEYIDNKRLYMYGCRTIQERLDSLRAAAARGTPEHSRTPAASEPGRGVGGALLRRRSASHERVHTSPAVAPPPRSASQERLLGAEPTAAARDWPRSASEDAITSLPAGVHEPRARSCDCLGRQREGGASPLDMRARGPTEAHDRLLLYAGDGASRCRRNPSTLHRTASGYAHDGRGGSYPGLSATPLLSKGTGPALSSRAQSLGNTAALPLVPRLAAQTAAASLPPASYVASALASLHARGGAPRDQRPAPVDVHLCPGQGQTEAGLGVSDVVRLPPAGGGEGADVTVVVLRRQKPGAPPLRHPSYIQAVSEREGSGDTPTCWLANDSRRDVLVLRRGEQHKPSGSAHLDNSLDSIPFIDEPSSPSVEHDIAHIPACAVISSTPVIAEPHVMPASPTSALIRRQLSHDQDSLRLTILESDSGTKTERSKSYDEGLDHFREGRGRTIKQVPALRGLRKAVDGSSEDSGSRRNSSSDVFSDATKEGLLYFRQLNSDKGKRVGSGLRPWKQMYTVLRGCSLYLHKDKKEGPAYASSLIEDDPRPISIKACLIDISYSDTKRKNVLRLTTSDCEYLFQAEDRDDMLSWIRAIQENSNLDEENALITSTDLINRKIKEYNTLMSPSSSKTEPSPRSSRQSLSIRHALLGSKGDSKVSVASPSKEHERRGLHKDEASPPRDKGQWRKAIPGLMRKPFEKKTTPGVTFGVRLDDCPPAHTNRFVPLIVEVCCKLVEERGLEYTGIYRVPGNNAAISSMQEELNKGVGDIDVQAEKWKDLNVISSLLKSFFRKLPEPLFTDEKYADFIDANRTEDPVERLRALKRLLHALPDHHYETLKFLSAHLKTVADNSEKNKMEPRNLAIVFGPTLVRTSDDNMTHMVTHMPDQYKIVETLIQHYDWFFTDEGGEEPATSVQQESAVDTQPVPNIDHLLTNIGRTGTAPGEVSDSPTSDSAKSKGSWGSGKDQYSRELVSSIFAVANRKRKKHPDKLLASSSDDDLDPDFPKKELPNHKQNQQAVAGDTSPIPHDELAAGAKHDGKDGETILKIRMEHRNSFFIREKALPTASPKQSISPNLNYRTSAPTKSSLSDPPSQVDETTSDLGTMSSGASVPRSRPRRWGTVPPAGLELSLLAGASATAEVSSITSDYSTTSSNTFLTGVESSVLSPEVQSVAESRGGDEADDERSELISEGRPMETDSEGEFPVFTSRGAATPALDCVPGKAEPTKDVDSNSQKPESRRLLPSHKLMECDTLSRRRSLRQKTDSESSVEGVASGGGRGPSRSEPNRLSRVLEAMKKGRSSGSLSSTSSSRSESERGEPARRLKITERLKSHLRSSADDMFGLGWQRSRLQDSGSRKKGVRRRHSMSGQRDFSELAVINDWREQGGPDQRAELSPTERPKPQRGTRDVSIRDWIARERWRGGGSRAGTQPNRSEVKAGVGEALCNPASAPSPQMSTEQVNGGAGAQGKGVTLVTDTHPHTVSGAHVRSRFYQCL